MNAFDTEIRQYSTQDLLGQLQVNQSKFNSWSLITLGDELLQRGVPIEYLSSRFEQLIRSLGARELKQIDQQEQFYSKATVQVAIDELVKRNKSTVKWFLLIGQAESEGPFDRNELLKRIENENLKDALVWKQGEEEWQAVESMPRLTKPFFFDQYFEERRPATEEQLEEADFNERPIAEIKKLSAAPIVAGILEFISLPMWIASLVFSAIYGYDTELGMMIPILFSSFATLAAIPVGIGLLMRKKWAWSIKMTVVALSFILIALKTMYGDVHGVWVMFLAYQVLIALLIGVSRNEFE